MPATAPALADSPKRVERLTVAEAAAHARRHDVTVRRALEDGTLHGTQRVKGGRWTVRLDCLDAYLDGELCTHQQTAAPARRRRPTTPSATVTQLRSRGAR